MTSESRRRLSQNIQYLVSAATDDRSTVSSGRPLLDEEHFEGSMIVRYPRKGVNVEFTQEQLLGLAVFLGEPDEVIASALIDLLIEKGYAKAAGV